MRTARSQCHNWRQTEHARSSRSGCSRSEGLRGRLSVQEATESFLWCVMLLYVWVQNVHFLSLMSKLRNESQRLETFNLTCHKIIVFVQNRKENLHVCRYFVEELNFIYWVLVLCRWPSHSMILLGKQKPREAACLNPLSVGSGSAVCLANFQVFTFTLDWLHFCLKRLEVGGVIVTTSQNKY